MAIDFTCPACGAGGKIADHWRGGSMHCPKCGAKVNISYDGRFSVVSAAQQDDSAFLYSVTADDVSRILRELGYDFEQSIDHQGDPMFRVQLHRFKTLVLMYGRNDDGSYRSMQLSAVFNKIRGVDMRRCNEWNRQMRYVTLSIDQDEDLFLETDVLVDGGIHPNNVKRWIERFEMGLMRFTEFADQS